MNDINLEYDNKTMDFQILKDYCQKINIPTFSKPKVFETKDLYGNVYKVNLIDQPVVLVKTVTQQMFTDIVNNIRKKSEQIIAVEYFMRGILPVDTKREIDKIIEYIEHYGEMFEADEDLKKLKYDELHMTIDEYFPLSTFAAAFCKPLVTGGAGFCITAHGRILFALNMIEKCFTDAGCFQFSVSHDEIINKSVMNLETNIMTIFEDSDLDSAIDTLLSAWSTTLFYRSLKHIFVQESIQKQFIAKLTERLNNFQWKLPVGYTYSDRLQREKQNAIKMCLKDKVDHVLMDPIFYSCVISEYFKPLIVFDKSYRQFGEFDKYIPVMNLQAFRTTKEVISLVNAVAPTGVSVWCNSSSVWNEIGFALDINSVWVNCYDCKSPAVNPHYIRRLGDKKMYIRRCQNNEVISSTYDFVSKDAGNYGINFSNLIEKMTKLQEDWKSKTFDKRASVFFKAARNLDGNADLKTKVKDSSSYQSAVKHIKDAGCLSHRIKNESFIVKEKLICTEVIEPLGLIVIREEKFNMQRAIYSAVAAMVYGNGVLFSTNSANTIEVLKSLSDSGLPIVSFNDVEFHNGYLQCDAVKGKWLLDLVSDFQDDDKYKIVDKECNEINLEVYKAFLCYRKAIWNTYGETFSN